MKIINSFGLAMILMASTGTARDDELRGTTALLRRRVQNASPATIVSTIQTSLPGNQPAACEWDWTIRLLTITPDYVKGKTPRRMYMASCDTGTTQPTMFTSYTVGTKVDAGYQGTSGAITRSVLNPVTGALEVAANYHFPECRSMHGIAASSDCGTVAALCRIPKSGGFDHDAVAVGPDPSWMTNEVRCKDGKMNDQMWLYEWPTGDLSQRPTKVIVHKSIGSWEYGQDYLRYGEKDGTYGIALKAVKKAGSVCHESDSFMMLRRSDWQFEPNRGWTWACAFGHTIHNRPAFDPVASKYGILCSTDENEQYNPNYGEVVFRREDQTKHVIQHIPSKDYTKIKGGAGPLIPRDGGGFLGIVVAEPPPRGAGYDYKTTVELGLVTFDSDGRMVGGVKWIERDPTYYLSWPQLARLGENRYLLAWGRGFQPGTETNDEDRDISLRIPWSYWAMEIDGSGNALTPRKEVQAGWGEVNEMVPLGPGRVAWSYVPQDRRKAGGDDGPPCNQKELVHYVYTSKSAVQDNPLPAPPPPPVQDPPAAPFDFTAKAWRIATPKSSLTSRRIWDVYQLRLFTSSDCSTESVVLPHDGTPIDSGHHPDHKPANAFLSDISMWGGRPDENDMLWLGIEFDREVTVRCVAVDQFEQNKALNLMVQANTGNGAVAREEDWRFVWLADGLAAGENCIHGWST